VLVAVLVLLSPLLLLLLLMMILAMVVTMAAVVVTVKLPRRLRGDALTVPRVDQLLRLLHRPSS
jgi:hypothetical protein